MASRTVIAIDLVPERLQRGRERGIEVLNLDDFDSGTALLEHIRDRTGGRGPDAVIDAVGVEAHGSPAAKLAHKITEFIPNALAERLMRKAGVDRLAALHLAIDTVKRRGTISVNGAPSRSCSTLRSSNDQ